MSAEELSRYEQRVIEAEEELRRQAKIEALLARAKAITAPMPIRGQRPQIAVAGGAGPAQTGGRSPERARQEGANSAGPAQTGGRLFEPNRQVDDFMEGLALEGAESDQETEEAAAPKRHERTPNQAKAVKPPRFELDKKYETKGLRAKKTFEAKLRYHFKQNAWYYEAEYSDQRKILTAVNAFGEDMLDRWAQFEDDGADVDNMTWQEFDDFLLRQIKAPELLRDDANRTYQNLFQRTNQRVTEFSRVLRNWEQQLDVTYNDAQRKNHLKGRILDSLRRKAQETGKAEPEGYEPYVTHLQAIEDNMPERRKELRQPHHGSNDKSGKSPDPGTGSGSRNSSSSRGRRGASRGRSNQRFQPYSRDLQQRGTDNSTPHSQDSDVTCGHCHKKGHTEKTCFTLHPELRPSRNNRGAK
jgi:hypothetical protein